MRISYLLVADAVNHLEDGRLNFLGANWTAIAVRGIPSVIPIAIAFGAEGDPDDAGVRAVRVELREPNGKHSVLVDDSIEVERTKGPEGVPAVSVSGGFSGMLEVEAEGLHSIDVKVGDAEARTVFVVHDRGPKSPAPERERRATTTSPRKSGRRPKR